MFLFLYFYLSLSLVQVPLLGYSPTSRGILFAERSWRLWSREQLSWLLPLQYFAVWKTSERVHPPNLFEYSLISRFLALFRGLIGWSLSL